MLANVVLLASDPTLHDDVVISRVLAGQTEEYEILVRRYNNLLYRTARGILNTEHDIEDAMQEAYLRAYEKLHQFKSEAKFSTWLTRILINCALQQVNKLKREHLRFENMDEEGRDTLSEVPDDPIPNPKVGENLRKAVETAIDQLPSKYRVVFMLREIEHQPVLDVALLLNISEENVKIRLHRAKAMLRSILQAEFHSMDVFEFQATRCALLASRVMGKIVTH